ncbi:reverse transcriptase/maturase family protein [Eubacterium xylanophilum]|uniref:reverse transcriptase/maturase family protein n=1 Tax=Eubacterium xylanophilum TaxID=39497 RepID=UPI00047D838E|nr:reverse transcriptase/maturase family protein [Eubacterium xylanophilum]
MEIIDKIKDHDLWIRFMEDRISKGCVRNKECEELKTFVNERKYLKLVLQIERTKEMPVPYLLEVNKSSVSRKRQVFTVSKEENYILKMFAYLLNEYDDIFSENLYSFRSGSGVKKAISTIKKNVNLEKVYTYKADIKDYFNSISADNVLKMFSEYLPSEKWMLSFLEKLLKSPFAIKDGSLVEIKKGVMAGFPTAGFLANLYLKELDEYFFKKGVIYARYSDDIIVFANSQEEICVYEDVIKNFLSSKGLEINPRKEVRTVPGEKIEFLGVEFWGNQINVSDMTEKKLKAKIKRKARALYRWKIRKNATDERTARAMIRFLNNKFYNNSTYGEITWCRWYFPLITKDDKLKRIDQYAVDSIRYLYTGRHGKSNYNLTYQDIKLMGYRSLVNSFWKFKKGKYEVSS